MSLLMIMQQEKSALILTDAGGRAVHVHSKAYTIPHVR